MIKTPFKFLEPYSKEDHAAFFGRNKEIELLYELLHQTDLILLTGRSGTGKTSVIQCGLANRMEDHLWHPFYIRRNEGYVSSAIAALQDKIKEYLPSFSSESLANCVQTCVSLYFKPVYLILDQFEELFILGNKDEPTNLANELLSLQNIPNCKVIIVIREEYLAELFTLEDIIPSIYDFKLRLEKMGKTKIFEVLKSSFNSFNISLDGTQGYEDIYRNVSEGKLGVDLAYLQIYLDMFYKEDCKRTYPKYEQRNFNQQYPPLTFTSQEISEFGTISDVLSRFLDEQIEKCSAAIKDKFSIPDGSQIGKELLDLLVTDFGTKKPIAVGIDNSGILYIKEELLIPKHIPSEVTSFFYVWFQSARLVRISNGGYLELAHDSLASLIKNRRSAEEEELARMRRMLEDVIDRYERYETLIPQTEIPFIQKYAEKYKVGKQLSTLLDKSIAAYKDQERAIIIQKEKELKTLRQSLATECVFKASRQEDRTTAFKLLEIGNYIDKNNLKVTEELIRNYFLNDTLSKVPYRKKYCGLLEPIIHLSISPKGQYLSILQNTRVVIFDLYSFQELYEMSMTDAPWIALFFQLESPDKVIYVSQSGEVARFDFQQKQAQTILNIPEENYIRNTYYNRAKGWLFLVEYRTITIISSVKNEIIRSIQLPFRIQSMDIDSNGEYLYVLLVSGDMRKIQTSDWVYQDYSIGSKMQSSNNNSIKRITKIASPPHKDDQIILADQNHFLREWLFTNKNSHSFESRLKPHQKNINHISFSPHGKYFASAAADRSVHVSKSNTFDLEFSLEGHGEAVQELLWNDEETVLVSAEANGVISIWDLDYRKKDTFPKEFSGTFPERDMITRFSSDGRWIIGASKDGTVYIWKANSNKIWYELSLIHQGVVNAVALDEEDRILITASDDETICIWNFELIKNHQKSNTIINEGDFLIKQLKGQNTDIVDLSLNKNAELLATAGFDGSIVIWDLVKGIQLRKLTKHEKMVYSVSFSKESDRIVSTSFDKSVIVWDARSGSIIFQQKMQIDPKSQIQYIPFNALFSKDGRFIFVASTDNTVKIIDAKNQEELVSLSGHSSKLIDICEIPERNQLVTVCQEGLIKIWDYETVSEIFTITENYNSISSVDATIIEGDVHLIFSDMEKIHLRAVASSRIIQNVNHAEIAGELTPFELEQLDIESLLPAIDSLPPKELISFDFLEGSEEKMFNLGLYFLNRYRRTINKSLKEEYRENAFALFEGAQKVASIYLPQTYERLKRECSRVKELHLPPSPTPHTQKSPPQ